MICPKCGSTLTSENTKYCQFCGAKITPEKPETQGFNQNVANNSPAVSSSSHQNKYPSTGHTNPHWNQPSVYSDTTRSSPAFGQIKKERWKKAGPEKLSCLNPSEKTPEMIGKVNFILQIIMICLLINIILLFLVVKVAGQSLRNWIDSIPSGSETQYVSSSILSLYSDDSDQSLSIPSTEPVETPSSEPLDESKPSSQPPESSQESEPESTSEEMYFIEQTFDHLDYQPDYVIAEPYLQYCSVVTKNSNLNIRSGPGTDYDIIGKAPKSSIMIVKGFSANIDDWILIEYNDVIGWVSSEYVVLM